MEVLTNEQESALTNDLIAIQEWIMSSNPASLDEFLNNNINPIFKTFVSSISNYLTEIKSRQKSDNDEIKGKNQDLNQFQSTDFNDLLAKNQQLKNQVKELEDKLTKMENENQKLVHKNEEFQKKIGESVKSNFDSVFKDFENQRQCKIQELSEENAKLKIDILNLQKMANEVSNPQKDFPVSDNADVFSELQNHFNNLIVENSNIQHQLDISSQECTSLKNKLELSNLANQNLTNQLEYLKQEFDVLTAQMEDLEEQLSDSQNKINKYKKQDSELNDLIDNLKSEVQSKANESKVIKEKFENIQNEKDEILQQNELLNNKQIELTNEIEKMKSKLSSFQEENKKIKLETNIENKKLNDQIIQLNQRIDELTIKNEDLNQIIIEKKKENETIIKAQENAALSQRELAESSIKTIEDLNKHISELMENQSNLSTQVESLQIELSSSKETINKLENELNEAKHNLEGTDYEELNKKIEEKQNEIDSLNKRIEQFTDKHVKIQEIETLKNVNKNLRKSQLELKTELASVKSQLAKSTSEFEIQQQKCIDLQNQINKARPESISLREKQQHLIKLSQNVQQANIDLTRKNIEKDQANKILNDKLEQLSNEISKLKTENENLRHEIANLKSNAKSSKNNIEEFSSVSVNQNNNYSVDQIDNFGKMKEEKKILQKKLLKAVNMCKSLQSAKSELTVKNEQLSSQLQKVSLDLNSMRQDFSQLYEVNEKLKKEKTKMIEDSKNASLNRQANELDQLECINPNPIKVKESQCYSFIDRGSEQELQKLNEELLKRQHELAKVKRQFKKTINDLKKENSELKEKQKKLDKQKKKDNISDIQESKKKKALQLHNSDINTSKLDDLRVQNDALKRRNELITQNFELEILELQTALEQKEQMIEQLQYYQNDYNYNLNQNINHDDPNYPAIFNSRNSMQNTQSSYNPNFQPSNDVFQSQFERLIRERDRAGSRRGFYQDSMINIDDLESLSEKFVKIITKRFQQISSKLLALNSKVSFLQYKLQIKQARNDNLAIPTKLYSLMQLLGVQKRGRPSIEQISNDIYSAVLKQKDRISDHDNIIESIADKLGLDSVDEGEILEEANKKLKHLNNIEIKYKKYKEIINNIKQIMDKETDNDDFADSIRLLFVNHM